MAYTFETKEFGQVGKGNEDKPKYQANQVVEDTWKHENEAELIKDLLEICDGKFATVQAITLNGVQQYLRFKSAPGADPKTKILAFAKKAGLSKQDLLALLESAE